MPEVIAPSASVSKTSPIAAGKAETQAHMLLCTSSSMNSTEYSVRLSTAGNETKPLSEAMAPSASESRTSSIAAGQAARARQLQSLRLKL